MREEKASALPLLLDGRRRDENTRAYAYRMLRKNIRPLRLRRGCQLSEAERCEQLAMSRTPVHEALMMLKSEWLVDVLPQRGSIVSKISVPYLNEGFAMRRILEPALLRGLAGKLTREQLNEFQELLNRQNEDLYLDQDAADDFFISLDNDFHRLLYHDSGYDRIWEAMHNVTSHMDRVRYLDSALCRGNIASVQKEHEQIFGYLRDGLPLEKVPLMTEKEYFTRGCTALLDAVGGAIHHIGNIHKYARREDVPEKTMFIITTDGYENASRRYSYETVRRMIERQKEKYGWEFLFLGANIDAAKEAARFGIGADRAVNYKCDEAGTALNYEVISEAVCCVRAASPLSADWKRRIDEDVEKRGR